MTSGLFDTIRQIVHQELKQLRFGELAVVQEQHAHASDSDKDNYSCTVVLRDSSIVIKQVPVATGRLGMVAIPDVGDLVLVQFVHGDVNQPIIVGSLYSDEDRPPASSDGQVVMQLPKSAAQGDGIYVVAKSADESSLKINVADMVVVNLKEHDPPFEVVVDNGGATIKIEQDGTLTVESQSEINIKGSADVNIEAGGTLNLKGSVVNIN